MSLLSISTYSAVYLLVHVEGAQGQKRYARSTNLATSLFDG